MALEPVGNLLVRGGVLVGPEGVGDDGRCRGRRADVRITAGVVAEVGAQLRPREGEEVLEVAGAAVLPGLHDHHLHLRAMMAARRSVQVGPPEVADASSMVAALRGAPVDEQGWRRAVGYHESVAGELDRWVLDAMVPGAKVRVQHRSGVLWVVSSAGVEELGLDEVDDDRVERDGGGRVTGRLWRMDGWLQLRLGTGDVLDEDAAVGAELASWGVTGVTDATPGLDAAAVAGLAGSVTTGRMGLRLCVMCAPGVALPAHPLIERGPQKILLDDDRLPVVDELVATVRRAHDAGVPVAMHCVTAVQLALALAALTEAGAVAGDRIEHAAVVPASAVAALAALGVTVVINPGLLHARGDTYRRELPPREHAELHRAASLLAGGVALAAGTDAPLGPADPWVAVHGAHRRQTVSGATMGVSERLPLAAALGLFLGRARAPARRRQLAVGEPGDLCVLGGADLPAPAGRGGPVAATVVAGRVVHRSG